MRSALRPFFIPTFPNSDSALREMTLNGNSFTARVEDDYARVDIPSIAPISKHRPSIRQPEDRLISSAPASQ